MLPSWRFWLNWAILTLPLAVCTAMWIRSQWAEDLMQRTGYHNLFQIGSRYGSLEIIFMRHSDWDSKHGLWSYQCMDLGDPADRLTQNRLLGFGLESSPGPVSSMKAISIEVPIASLTLLALIPPIWTYRRRRKRRTTGFPLEPVKTESTSWAP